MKTPNRLADILTITQATATVSGVMYEIEQKHIDGLARLVADEVLEMEREGKVVNGTIVDDDEIRKLMRTVIRQYAESITK
jgi:hypothetical protein